MNRSGLSGLIWKWARSPENVRLLGGWEWVPRTVTGRGGSSTCVDSPSLLGEGRGVPTAS